MNDYLMTPDIFLGAFLMSKGIKLDSTKYYDNLTYFVFQFDEDTQDKFEDYQLNPEIQELKKSYLELEKKVIRFDKVEKLEWHDEC